ncbi:MAG: O-antigen ligase family protein [Patescibacteria group bacterium]
MLLTFSRAIPLLFNLLFFFVPLVLYPYSYELFEFNKMIATYALTVLIVAAWLIRMILAKKIIFRRTIFDVPIVLFLLSQVVSTLFSIDFRTSLLGYYSRFNGGLFPTLSYSLLFWAFISNMDRTKTVKAIEFLLSSGVVVSIYAVLQHFGIDKDVWVQDVQNRVFSTLGQPNWLAAFLVLLLPLTWYFAKFHSLKTKKNILFILITILFTLSLAYTKSRSGLLAFAVVTALFWGLNYSLKNFLVLTSLSLVLIFVGGTAWTPSLEKFLATKPREETKQVTEPALEVGGTESGAIRKIVWQGAVDIWRRYPLTGSGPETFAFAYYQFRPVEHNLVSEWDFLYNKAHNEFLNILATTGILGLAAYLYLIAQVFLFLVKKLRENQETLDVSLLSGFSGILVTNFFGFSVVPTALLFFLYPAMAVSLRENNEEVKGYQKLEGRQNLAIGSVLLISFYLLYSLGKYWSADLLFAKGKALNDANDPVGARNKLVSAIKLSTKEAIFWDELSQSDALIVEALSESSERQKAKEFADLAVSESERAITLSPRNLNLKRSRANVFIKLSTLDPGYLAGARDTLLDAVTFAPTDAKLYFNLGLTYARLGDVDNALKVFEKAINLKGNYKDARLAYALILIDKGQRQKAKEELTYILEKIDPNDPITRQTLEEIK